MFQQPYFFNQCVLKFIEAVQSFQNLSIQIKMSWYLKSSIEGKGSKHLLIDETESGARIPSWKIYFDTNLKNDDKI